MLRILKHKPENMFCTKSSLFYVFGVNKIVKIDITENKQKIQTIENCAEIIPAANGTSFIAINKKHKKIIKLCSQTFKTSSYNCPLKYNSVFPQRIVYASNPIRIVMTTYFERSKEYKLQYWRHKSKKNVITKVIKANEINFLGFVDDYLLIIFTKENKLLCQCYDGNKNLRECFDIFAMLNDTFDINRFGRFLVANVAPLISYTT
jgi:hypothetical protein